MATALSPTEIYHRICSAEQALHQGQYEIARTWSASIICDLELASCNHFGDLLFKYHATFVHTVSCLLLEFHEDKALLKFHQLELKLLNYKADPRAKYNVAMLYVRFAHILGDLKARIVAIDMLHIAGDIISESASIEDIQLIIALTHDLFFFDGSLLFLNYLLAFIEKFILFPQIHAAIQTAARFLSDRYHTNGLLSKIELQIFLTATKLIGEYHDKHDHPEFAIFYYDMAYQLLLYNKSPKVLKDNISTLREEAYSKLRCKQAPFPDFKAPTASGNANVFYGRNKTISSTSSSTAGSTPVYNHLLIRPSAGVKRKHHDISK